MGVCLVVQSELSDAAKAAGGSAAEPVKHALLPLPATHRNRSIMTHRPCYTVPQERGGGRGAAAMQSELQLLPWPEAVLR